MTTMTFYTHWRDVPEAAWRWPNFSPAEIACRGTGKLLAQRGRARQAPGAAGPARQAPHRPLGLSQPGAQPRRRRREALEAHGGHRLRHRHGEPRPGGLRGGGARGRLPRLRLLSALGLHAHRPRAGAEWGERFPKRATAVRRRDAARAGGAGREPDA